MKRFIVLFVALVLNLSFLAVPVFAQESFYFSNQYSNQFSSSCDGYLPAGSYIGQVYVGDTAYFDEKITFNISYVSYDDMGVMFEKASCEISASVNGVVENYLFYIYPYSDHTSLSCYSLKLGSDAYAILEPVTVVSSPDISSIVSSDVLPDVVSRLFQLIINNPLLSALCGASLIMVCIPLFKDLKNSAR